MESDPSRDESMVEIDAKRSWAMVNGAPVFTLWAAVVAEVPAYEHDEALTLRRQAAGMNACGFLGVKSLLLTMRGKRF